MPKIKPTRLKHTKIKAQNVVKKVGNYKPLKLIYALQQLNRGPIWIKLENDQEVVLQGADIDAWQGIGNLHILRNGVEETIPASTKIKGYYFDDYDQFEHIK